MLLCELEFLESENYHKRNITLIYQRRRGNWEILEITSDRVTNVLSSRKLEQINIRILVAFSQNS